VLASKNFSQTDRAGVRELKGRLIKQLPKMPVYQGAKVSRSYEKREASKVGYEGTWTVGAPIAEVAAWYRRMLPRLGWKILEHNEGDDEQNMLIQKGGRNAYLWVERKGNVTEITVEFPMAPEVR
jgi:hypothetical protein